MEKPEPDKQQRLIAAYKAISLTEHWKLIDEDLSRFCLEKADIFVPDSARKTDFNLGANSVIRYIRYMLKRKTEQKPEKVISERKIL